jgi:hypothetical protein
VVNPADSALYKAPAESIIRTRVNVAQDAHRLCMLNGRQVTQRGFLRVGDPGNADSGLTANLQLLEFSHLMAVWPRIAYIDKEPAIRQAFVRTGIKTYRD